MLPVLLTVWHHIYALAADPAWDSTLLLLIILAEIHAIYHDRIQTEAARSQVQIAHQTYELYKQYFETTEKRKADWREAQRRSRAAKKEKVLLLPTTAPGASMVITQQQAELLALCNPKHTIETPDTPDPLLEGLHVAGFLGRTQAGKGPITYNLNPNGKQCLANYQAAPEPELEPVPEVPPEEPVPPPTDGQVPPLVLPEEGDPEEQQ